MRRIKNNVLSLASKARSRDVCYCNSNFKDFSETFLQPPGACDVSSSESNMPHSVITLDDNVISKNIMNELHGSVIAQESSHYDVYNGNFLP